MALLKPPFDLCTAVAAGTTLEKVLWPGSYTVTLPSGGEVATIVTGGNIVGGVFQPLQAWGAVYLDFAMAAAADTTIVVEIGQVLKDGTLTRPLASASLKSITTAGTVTANTNPFTGAAVSSTTYRLIDLTTLTNNGQLGQLLTDLNGTENNLPSRLILATDQGLYYYVVVTTLSTATKVLCVITPEE